MLLMGHSEMGAAGMFLRETALTSIFMIIKRRLAAAMCWGALVVPVLAIRAQSGSVEEIVRNLGRGTSEIDQVHTLAKYPTKSVELLINQLHIVPDRHLLIGENPFTVEHVLWCLRALRFITGGKDFCAPTSHVFGTGDLEQRQKYLLEFSHGSCLTFFSIWPSRMSTYIAPPDAQRKIIQQWGEWLQNEGRKAAYSPLKDPKPAQWLW